MIILQATGDLRKVSLWLGHADMQTTEVYLRADPTEKIAALEAVVPPTLRRGASRCRISSLPRYKGNDYGTRLELSGACHGLQSRAALHNLDVYKGR